VTRIIDISGNASFSIINLNPSGTNGDVFIPLFVEHNLPDSISISTNDGQYDYNSLVNIAKAQSFEGSIIDKL